MLTGRYEAIPGEGSQVTPSTWNSMSDSFKASFNTPFLLTPQSPEKRRDLSDSITAMQMAANSGDQGMGQKTANWFASFAGSILNPYSLMLGEGVGAVASRAIPAGAGLLGKYLPVPAAVVATGIAQKKLGSFLGEGLPNFVGESTIGGLTKGAVSGYAMATGFSLPQAIADTYDPKQDAFNWWGGVKTSFADGGIALGLMSVPFLGGTLWGKMFRGAAKEVSHAEMPLPHEGKVPEGVEPSHPLLAKIDEAAANKKISPHEAQWFRDYVTGAESNENLTKRAIELLIKDGHPVDAATKKVLLQLFKPEDIEQLQIALADKMSSVMPDNMKSLFHDFLINGKIDAYRANTKMLDGLQGVVEFIRKRLKLQPDEMNNVNAMLKGVFPKLKGKNPFSQTKLFNALKSGKEVPLTVPRQVTRRLNKERKIKSWKERINKYQRLFDKTNNPKFNDLIKRAHNKISELESSMDKLLTHNEELSYLRSKLMKEGKVRDDFKSKREYHRLLDLARNESGDRIKNSARKLLHELNTTHEYEMHGHYANFLDALTKVMRSSVGDLADHNNVLNYMKERLVREKPELEKVETKATKVENKVERNKEVESEIKGDEIKENKAFKDDAVKEMDQEMKDAPEEIKKDFDQVKNQFDEFNEKQGVFKNLIKCVMGSLNG